MEINQDFSTFTRKEKVFIEQVILQCDQKKGRKLAETFLGPLSETVDLEDPANQDLKTLLIWDF